jgi:hypothetical protein
MKESSKLRPKSKNGVDREFYPFCQTWGTSFSGGEDELDPGRNFGGLERIFRGCDYPLILPGACLENRMLKSLIAAAVFVSATAVVTQAVQAKPPTSAAPEGPASLDSRQAREDFDLLRHALEDAHPGLYRYSSKAEMDRTLDAFGARLVGPTSTADFEAVITQVLAAIRCGHTSLTPDVQLETAMREAKTFPLRVMVQGEGLVVMLNDTPADATIRPGMELLEINGRKVGEILERFWPCLSGDGDIQTGKRHDITGRFSHYYWWMVDRSERFTIKARDASGAVITATLEGVTDLDRKSNHNPINAPVMDAVGKILRWGHEDPSFRFIKEPDVAEIRLNYFLGDKFPAALESIFRTLGEKKTGTLIIDLRGNGGGQDEYGALLVSYLTDKPFRYFDRIQIKTLEPSFSRYLDGSPSFKEAFAAGKVIADPAGGFLVSPKLHRGLAMQQPEKFPFTGKVFVLTDGGTFSTAADFCAIVHSLGRATFIGEETGGGYFGNNSGPVPTLTLPNSKVRIRFPMYGYYNAVSAPQLRRRGTIPDQAVELKVSDLLKGIDAPLDRAVALANAAHATGR